MVTYLGSERAGLGSGKKYVPVIQTTTWGLPLLHQLPFLVSIILRQALSCVAKMVTRSWGLTKSYELALLEKRHIGFYNRSTSVLLKSPWLALFEFNAYWNTHQCRFQSLGYSEWTAWVQLSGGECVDIWLTVSRESCDVRVCVYVYVFVCVCGGA